LTGKLKEAQSSLLAATHAAELCKKDLDLTVGNMDKIQQDNAKETLHRLNTATDALQTCELDLKACQGLETSLNSLTKNLTATETKLIQCQESVDSNQEEVYSFPQSRYLV
jgi:hypothetical protein